VAQAVTNTHCLIHRVIAKLRWSGFLVRWVSSVLRPCQHSIGYAGDGFYRSEDPTNSNKVLKEMLQKNKKKTTTTKYAYPQTKKDKISTTSPLVYTNMGWLGNSSPSGQGRYAWTAVGLPPRYPLLVRYQDIVIIHNINNSVIWWMRTDWAPSGCQPSDQANQLGLWVGT